MTNASCRLAIDVGGTFTDIVLIDDGLASVWFTKVLTTPVDPARGSIAGASEILTRTDVAPLNVAEIIHATTVATNAVLEGSGAQTGLITTQGFRDILEMGREGRYDIYDLGIRVPPPLVPRRYRTEINERMSYDGQVLTTLDEDEVIEVLSKLVSESNIQSLAISLLHGYARPDHEIKIAEIATRLFPGLMISMSHQVSAEIREFERTSTTVVDAYVKPLVHTYVSHLNQGLSELGLRHEVSMMLSHGGIGSASDVASEFPVRMIESGPAAGAIAAGHFAREALELPDAIAFDMGGTTAKISVIRDGQPAIAHDYEVGHVHRFKRGSGYPLQISAIELLEIGAGGGSIAHISELGLLKVGPKSAGADPGPVCYGRGGRQPTVTDADLVLGYLDPDHFLGGEMKLDVDAVKRIIGSKISDSLKMPVEQIAWGIHDVVNESMAAATRSHAAEKGIDLRRYAMVAFGGAGPVHAYALARKLGIKRVLCPVGAGVASAIGCLAALPAVEKVTPFFSPLDTIDWSQVGRHFMEMRVSGETTIAKLIDTGSLLEMKRSIDLRCLGQGYSVTVPIGDDTDSNQASAGISLSSLLVNFEEIYKRVYGHRPPDVPLEVVGLRARVLMPRPKLKMALAAGTSRQREKEPLKGHRKAYFGAAGGYVKIAVYDRYLLQSGEVYSGPAVIEERETSIVVGPDADFFLDHASNIIIDFKETKS